MPDLTILQPLPTDVTINGARISGAGLVQILAMVTDPDPKRWFRFERYEDTILIEMKQE